MNPSERPPTSSSSKDTRDFVRELLARAAHDVPTRSDVESNGSSESVTVLYPQVIDAHNHSHTVPVREIANGHIAAPMPPLTGEELSQRAARPIPHRLPTDPRDPEIYRLIYAGLKLPQAPVVVIGVTSAIRGEGRSTIARLMAKTMSKELDVQVTLVDADFQHPSLLTGSQDGLQPGIASVLRDERQLDEVISRWGPQYPDLYAIPAGDAGHDTAWLLRRLGTHDPFRRPGGLRGLVILDLPPLADGSFGAVAAPVADATILVVRAGVTQADTVREAVARMGDRPPQGVVLNAFRSPMQGWRRGSR
ncbi:MAG: hypothetical protein JWO59_402 [Chloroflexi bacterium]|nr:hypothetical protein [Chloroflexota bacterium]MDB5076950.1 hypothetical protein [Chloroflexota bacterium]